MTFTIIANFKSHQLSADLAAWLNSFTLKQNSLVDLIITPSYPHLALANDLIKSLSLPLKLGAQDVSPFPPGSYTGAVSAKQLQEYGVTHAIIGHSERRSHFHETYQDVTNKARELLSVNITPAICLSASDIAPSFASLDDELASRCLYCFEPPSDIGGTTTAPLQTIQSTVDMIKQYGNYPVLYGGSVTKDNIHTLLGLNLDGVLVGTASLSISEFLALAHQVIAHEN